MYIAYTTSAVDGSPIFLTSPGSIFTDTHHSPYIESAALFKSRSYAHEAATAWRGNGEVYFIRPVTDLEMSRIRFARVRTECIVESFSALIDARNDGRPHSRIAPISRQDQRSAA